MEKKKKKQSKRNASPDASSGTTEQDWVAHTIQLQVSCAVCSKGNDNDTALVMRCSS